MCSPCFRLPSHTNEVSTACICLLGSGPALYVALASACSFHLLLGVDVVASDLDVDDGRCSHTYETIIPMMSWAASDYIYIYIWRFPEIEVPKIILLNGIFPYKPSILIHFGGTPFVETPIYTYPNHSKFIQLVEFKISWSVPYC